RVTLIHDGIDPARIASSVVDGQVRARYSIPVSSRVIGVVGNVKEWKGQDTLVRALPRIMQRFPDVYCLLVGSIVDTRYRELMQHHIDANGLGGRVVFTGYQRRPAEHMAEMDVVVHTSTAPEPFGLVMLEGMALGKPVIATAHGGPVDVIEDRKTGFLAEPGNEDMLADIL